MAFGAQGGPNAPTGMQPTPSEHFFPHLPATAHAKTLSQRLPRCPLLAAAAPPLTRLLVRARADYNSLPYAGLYREPGLQARLVTPANNGTDIYPRRDGEQDRGDGVLQSELAARDASLLLLRAELGKLPPGSATLITSQQQLVAMQAALKGTLQSMQEETMERVKASEPRDCQGDAETAASEAADADGGAARLGDGNKARHPHRHERGAARRHRLVARPVRDLSRCTAARICACPYVRPSVNCAIGLCVSCTVPSLLDHVSRHA